MLILSFFVILFITLMITILLTFNLGTITRQMLTTITFLNVLIIIVKICILYDKPNVIELVESRQYL